LNDQPCSQETRETVESLKTALQREWEELDEGMLRRIVDDFLRRLGASIGDNKENFE
jgi:hypothetical protein